MLLHKSVKLFFVSLVLLLSTTALSRKVFPHFSHVKTHLNSRIVQTTGFPKMLKRYQIQNLTNSNVLWIYDVLGFNPASSYPISNLAQVLQSVTYNHDSTKLAVGGSVWGVYVEILNTYNKNKIATYDNTNYDTNLSFSCDGRYLAMRSYSYTPGGQITIFDTVNNKELPIIKSNDVFNMWQDLKIAKNNLMALASNDWTVWLIQNFSLLDISRLNGHKSIVKSVSFSPDEKYLASVAKDGELIIWNLETKRPVKTFRVVEEDQDKLASLAWSADGSEFAVGTYSGDVIILDAYTGEQKQVLESEWTEADVVKFNEDGSQLAIQYFGNEVGVWERSAPKAQKFNAAQWQQTKAQIYGGLLPARSQEAAIVLPATINRFKFMFKQL
jgi:WD40 repeat protein